MSTTTNIDENIVSMKFNNKDFEKNAAATMSTLEKLKSKLNFEKVKDSLNEIDVSKIKKAFDKVGDIDTGKFEKVMSQVEYRMSTLGVIGARIAENFADKLFNVIDSAFSKLMGLYNFAKSGITQGGYSRASNIQAARFQLEGLGIAWKDIYGDIDYAVTNTAYSLDAAAKVAAQLSASGVKVGTAYVPTAKKNDKSYVSDIDTMAMTLRAISGTAAMTNSDYSEIGRIITQMVSRGRIYQDDLNQLSNRGLGVKGLLADYLTSIKYGGRSKWTETTVSEEVSKAGGGSISPEILIEFLYEKFGEFATKANSTLSGVIANTRSAFARLGAGFIEPIIANGGPLVNLIDAFRVNINEINKALIPVLNTIGTDIGKGIGSFARKFYYEIEMTDKDGNPILDENGEVMKKKIAKSGLIRDLMETEKRVTGTLDVLQGKDGRLISGTAASEILKGTNGERYLDIVEEHSKAAWILIDAWTGLKNIGSGISAVFSDIGYGFKSMFPDFNLADKWIKITQRFKEFTQGFTGTSTDTGRRLVLFGKTLASVIQIIGKFASSFKKHIIDPLFGKTVKPAADSASQGMTNIFNKIIEFNEWLDTQDDFFGGFFEKIKSGAIAIKNFLVTHFSGIGKALKAFFTPIVEIFQNSDLTFLDKLKAVRDYLVQDFVMPGWEKVKSVFEGIGDAVKNVFSWFKKLFGFSDKEDSGITTTGATSGNNISGMPANISGVQLVAMSETFKNVATNVNEGTKQSKSALESFKDWISNVDFSPAAIALTAISVAVIALVGVILYAVVVLPAKLLELGEVIPRFLDQISSPFGRFSKTMRAVSFSNITEGLKNLGIALLSIAAAIAIFSILRKLMSPTELITGTVIVLVIFGILTAFVIKLAKASNALSSALEAGFSKDSGLWINSRIGLYAGMTALMWSILGMTVAVTGLALVFGLILKNKSLTLTIVKGFVMLILIMSIVTYFTIKIPAMMAKSVGGMTGNALAVRGLMSMAATITSMTIAVVTFTGLAIILQAVKWDTLKDGLLKIVLVAAVIELILYGVQRMAILSAGTSYSPARILLGMAAAIVAIGLAMTSIILAMKLLMVGINDKNISTFRQVAIAVGAILVIIGVTMAVVIGFVSKNPLQAKGTASALLGLAAVIMTIAGAMVIIVGAMLLLTKVLSNSDLRPDVIRSFLIVTAVMAGMFTGVYWLMKASKGMTTVKISSIAIPFAALAGGVLVIIGSISLLMAAMRTFNFDVYAVLGLLTSISILVVGMAYAGRTLINSLQKVNNKNLTVGKILSIAVVFISIGTAMGIAAASLALLGGLNMGQIIAGGVMITILGAEIALISYIMINIVKKKVKWDTVGQAILLYSAICLSLVILASAIAILASLDPAGMVLASVILPVMGLVISGISAILVHMSNKLKDTSKLLTVIGTYAAVSASLFVTGMAIKKLAGIPWEAMQPGLKAMLAVVAMLTLAMAALTIVSSIAPTGMDGAVRGMLAIAGVMVAVGLSAFLLAGAIDILLIVIEKLDKLGGDWDTKVTSFKEKIISLLRAIIDAVGSVALEFAGLAFKIITTALNFIGEHWDELGAAVTNCLQGLAKALTTYSQPIIDALLDILIAAIDGITSLINSAKGAILAEKLRYLGETIAAKIYWGIKEALMGTTLGEYLFNIDEAATALSMGKRNVLGVRTTEIQTDAVSGYLDRYEPGLGGKFLQDMEQFKLAEGEYEKIMEDMESLDPSIAQEAINKYNNSPMEGKDWGEYIAYYNDIIDTYIALAAHSFGLYSESILDLESINERHETRLKDLEARANQEEYEKAVEKANAEWPEKLKTLEEEKNTLEADLEYMQQQLESETGPAVVRSARQSAIDYQKNLIDNINKEIEAGPQVDYTPLYSDIDNAATDAANVSVNNLDSGIEAGIKDKEDGIRHNLSSPFKLDSKYNGIIFNDGWKWADTFLTGAKSRKGFDENSPSKAMIRIMEYVGQGMDIGTQLMMPMANDAGEDLASGFLGGADSALGDFNMNFENTSENIMNSLKDKLPSKDEFTGLFGLDKGIEGNIAGLKTAWGKIKGIFSGDFDISSVFSNLLPGDMDLSNMTQAFGANFNVSDFGYSDSFMTDKAWENSLANFDPNTMMTTDTLNLNLNIDDAELKKLNESMSTGVDWNAVAGGYNARSGSTYNYNYNYIQNNTSSGALNTRELNRTTQLALTRNRWRVGGGG